MTEQSTALATTSSGGNNALAFLHDGAAFEHTWRVAKAFSSSRMVPAHFQNKPEDCFVALQMAIQLEVNPLLALQNLQVIGGKPGFSASFAIGLANQRGPFRGPITWESEGKGDDLAVTAKGIIKATGEEVRVTVSMEMAKAEGWTKNPKYRSIPEQMLRYRSATWLIRLYAPDVLLGFGTSEEIEDTVGVQSVEVRDVSPAPAAATNPVAELNARIRKAPVKSQNREVASQVSDSAHVEDAVTVEVTSDGEPEAKPQQQTANNEIDDPF